MPSILNHETLRSEGQLAAAALIAASAVLLRFVASSDIEPLVSIIRTMSTGAVVPPPFAHALPDSTTK